MSNFHIQIMPPYDLKIIGGHRKCCRFFIKKTVQGIHVFSNAIIEKSKNVIRSKIFDNNKYY